MNPLLPPGVIGPADIPPPEGPLVSLARAYEKAPRILFDFVIGMLIASIVDPISLSLTIACILLGFVTGSWLIAATVFFFSYVVIRTVNNIAGAIGSSGRSIAERLSPAPSLWQGVAGEVQDPSVPRD